MPRSLEYIFVASVLGLLALIVGGAWLADRKRTRRWHVLARQLGFDVRDNHARDLVKALSALPLMNPRARKIVVKNVLVGARDAFEVCTFDVRLVTNPGTKMARHTAHTGVAVRCPGARIPAFAVRPRFPGSAWLSRMLDRDEIAIADHPRFSASFQLFGDEVRALPAAFSPAVLTTFEEQLQIANTCVEGNGEWLLVYSARGRDAVETVEARIDAALAIAMTLSATRVLGTGHGSGHA